MARVSTDAMDPSITRPNVDGMPRGRKLSAVGPIFALGIHAWTEHGGGTEALQMSSRCVTIAWAVGPGHNLHAAYGMPSGPGAESFVARIDLTMSCLSGGGTRGQR